MRDACAAYGYDGCLQQIAVDRPTARHSRRIIAVGTDNGAGASIGIHEPVASVLVLDSNSKLLWKDVLLPPTERVVRFAVVNHGKDPRDITLFLTGGTEIHLDFDGNVLANSSHRVTLRIVP